MSGDGIFGQFDKGQFYTELHEALSKMEGDSARQLCITKEGPRALTKAEMKEQNAVQLPLSLAKKLVEQSFDSKLGIWKEEKSIAYKLVGSPTAFLRKIKQLETSFFPSFQKLSSLEKKLQKEVFQPEIEEQITDRWRFLGGLHAALQNNPLLQKRFDTKIDNIKVPLSNINPNATYTDAQKVLTKANEQISDFFQVLKDELKNDPNISQDGLQTVFAQIDAVVLMSKQSITGYQQSLTDAFAKIQKQTPEENIAKKLVSLVEQQKHEEVEQLLKDLDPTILPLDHVKTALKNIGGPSAEKVTQILERAEALLEAQDAKHIYHFKEVLKIAAFVELRLQGLAKAGQTEFKRHEFGLVRSLRFDPEKKEVYILHKSKIRTEKGADVKEPMPGGTEKVAKPATKISLLLPQLVDAAVELVVREEAHLQKSPQDFKAAIEKTSEAIEKEAKLPFELGLADSEFLATTTLVAHYTKKKTIAGETLEVQKTSLMQTRLPHNLIAVAKSPTTTPEEYGIIFNSALRAPPLFHGKGRLHWDLKLDNFLIEMKNGKVSACRLTDFGSVLKIGEKPRHTTYGTPMYTAPELFGLSLEEWPTDEEKQKKIEAFAIGAMLYMVLFKTPFLPQELAEFDSNPAQKRAKIEENIARVDEAIQKNPQDPNLAYMKIVRGMLEPDPEKRFTFESAQALLPPSRS